MQRCMAFTATSCLAIGLLAIATRPVAAQGPNATAFQLRVCQSEADRRLPDYSFDQIQVASESRDQNVATVRWRAGEQGGRCTVATNGRLLAFTRDAGSPADDVNPGTTTKVTCESRRTERQECRIPTGAKIRLARQLSDSPCRPNDTYGQGPGYLWVAEGCRGEFDVTLPGASAGAGGSMRLTCESPVNVRRQCPIPAGSQARLIGQLGSTPCRPNQTYGVTPEYVWVKGGCRGMFEVTGGGVSGGGGSYTTRMVCESQSAAKQQCPVAGASQIRLIKQNSTSPCRLNETFGIGFGHIWVSNGCRGEFEVTVKGSPGTGTGLPGNGTGLADRVTCESNGGERAECKIRNGGQVQLIRQLSTAACVRNTTWGTGFGVLWVTKGCRGEFEVR